MKNCLQCGKQAEDWEAECTECGRAFAFAGAESEIESPRPVIKKGRPNGIDLIASGARYFWISIGLSIIGGIFIAAGAFPIGILAAAIASILFPLSGVFWATGKIVNAISFLPSKVK